MDRDEEIIEEVDDFDSSTAQKKLKQLRDELKQCQKEKAGYLQSLQRARADFINARRTEEEERKNLAQFIKKPLLLKIIEIVDNFERAFKAEREKKSPFTQGVHQIYNQLLKFLEENNVKRMEVEGSFFDPLYHESIGEALVKDLSEDHKIIEEIEPGYFISDAVLRPAKVKIGRLQNYESSTNSTKNDS